MEGSPLINAGDFTETALDYHGNVRDLSQDVGAVEFIGSTVDALSPTAPSSLEATVISSSRVDLSWSAATNNTGVAGYRIYRDDEQIGTTSETVFSDTGCQSATSYIYTVKAFDAAGNLSLPSNQASATTSSRSEDGGSSSGCFLSDLP
jgi:chitodextrinase